MTLCSLPSLLTVRQVYLGTLPQGMRNSVAWRTVGFIHRGMHAVNSIGVNLDAVSGAEGRTFLINGHPLGKACKDIWRPALGHTPAAPKTGFYVGVLAGGYDPQTNAQGKAVTTFSSTHVSVLHASMYDGTSCHRCRTARVKTHCGLGSVTEAVRPLRTAALFA